jgi:hypothetical protein
MRYSRFLRSRLLATGAAAVVFVTAFPAWASLGGDASTIQADHVQLKGTLRMTAARSSAGESYSVHEIQAASGTVVREYVSTNGVVFAVAFQGPWLPDVQQLFGSYFTQYAQAMQARSLSARRARRPIMIDEPGLSVQIGGHPRAFAGKAYIPSMLPAGVRPEDIQ